MLKKKKTKVKMIALLGGGFIKNFMFMTTTAQMIKQGYMQLNICWAIHCEV